MSLRLLRAMLAAQERVTADPNDYPEFTGIEIQWEYPDGEVVTGIIVGVNFDVGITIVRKDDKNWKLTCLAGKSSKDYSHLGDDYEEYFYCLLSMLKKGYYYAGACKAHGGGTMATCAWGS